MSELEPRPRITRVTYTDGETLGTAQVETGPPSAEGIGTALGAALTGLTRTIGERANAYPPYVELKAQMDATPWFRFRKRRELRVKANSLRWGGDALRHAVTETFGAFEVLSIENKENPSAD